MEAYSMSLELFCMLVIILFLFGMMANAFEEPYLPIRLNTHEPWDLDSLNEEEE